MGRPTDWWVLDLDADPTPGDPDAVTELADKLLDFAADADRARRTVAALGDDSVISTWVGKTGDAYRAEIGDLPSQLDKASTSYQLCGDALLAYAPRLADAQYQADTALAAGRAAQGALRTAIAQLGVAEDWASRAAAAANTASSTSGGTAPDPGQVAAAVRNAAAANARVSADQAQVDSARDDLARAKQLAAQAAALRDDAAHTAVIAIKQASDAGIHNKGFWGHVGDFLSTAWHDLVAACKILVMALGVIVLIVGGPLAWVLVAVAAVILIDTIVKYVQGKASLFDVFLAALACIPMVRGLTTVDELGTAIREGGALGGAVHLAGAVKTTAVESARGLSQFAANAPGKLAHMTEQVKSGAPAAFIAILHGDNISAAYRDAFEVAQKTAEAEGDPAAAATMWQGDARYSGIDGWSTDVAKPGEVLVGGYPGPSGYTVPVGELAKATDETGAVSGAKFFEGVQVAPSDGTYRGSYLFYQVTDKAGDGLAVARSTAATNTQFGAGGLEQTFVPKFADHVASGALQPFAVLDDGSKLPLSMTDLRVAPDQLSHLNQFTDTTAAGNLPSAKGYLETHRQVRSLTTRGTAAAAGYVSDDTRSQEH